MTDAASLRYLGVAVANYQHGEPWHPLPNTERDVVGLDGTLGPKATATQVVLDPTHSDVFEALKALDSQLPDWRGGLIAVWAGHGVGPDPFRLIVHDTAPTHSKLDTCAPADVTYAALRAGADQLLLVLDTCHSGAGLLETAEQAIKSIASMSHPPGSKPWIGVIASCTPYDKQDDQIGVAGLLDKLLAEGPATDKRTHAWSPHERYVDGQSVIDAIAAEWPNDELPRIVLTSVVLRQPFVPNPLYDPGAQERRAAVVHAPFVGRRRVLERVAQWSRASSTGLLALTGGPGLGKSTLLARIAALADPAARRAIEHGYGSDPSDLLPPPRETVLAVPARGHTSASLVAALVVAAGVAEPAGLGALADELSGRATARLIVIDGLDEAERDHIGPIAADVLPELAKVAQVVVAGRPVELPGRPLDELLALAGTVLDLDADVDLENDLRAFVERLLSEGGDGLD